jgi:hypothetical protein
MTARAPNWFEQKYIAGVIHKLQSAGWLLRSAVNDTGEINGNQVTWKIAGTGTATQMSTAIEDVPVMNADRTTVSATMADYEANDWIKTTDIEKMSENEQQVSQKTGGMAMGRKFDSLMIGTMDAAAGAINTVGDGSAAISITDLMTAQGNIADIGVGSYEYICALPTKLVQQLELYREFSNSQWVGDEFPLLKQIGARRFRGIMIVPMPSVFFNVPAANQIDSYLWVKDYLGFVPNYQMVSRIDYVPTKKAYLAANTMGCAQAVLLNEGVQRLRFATNVALTRPNP